MIVLINKGDLMDSKKVGLLIRRLRKEKNLTQKNLANQLNLSEQAVSKWERGIGFPDISIVPDLSRILEIGTTEILSGDLIENENTGVNMKKLNYFICPQCGSVTVSSGNAQVSCCSRNLTAQEPKKATDDQKMNVEIVEDEWYITSAHPMTKNSYIPFTAFAMGAKLEVVQHFPEWNLDLRIKRYGHGKLIWYTPEDGLLYQLI